MEQYKKIINTLLVLLTVSIGLAVYAFLRKGTAAPPVSLFMYKKDLWYYPESSYKAPPFWDNYPYWILISQGRKINLHEYLNIDPKDINNYSGLIFRFHYDKSHDSLSRALLTNIFKHSSRPIILADERSFAFLKSINESSSSSARIFKIMDELPLDMERLQLSYFFTWSGASREAENIFVPRAETPEVTLKYMDHFKDL